MFLPDLEKLFRKAIWIAISLMALALFVGLGLGWLLFRS